jgi:heme exporter protein A
MASSKRLFSGTNIACRRGGRMLFQRLDFGMDPGDILHLSGPNGSGKSSLLRIMCGLLPQAAGKVEWNGNNFLENGIAAHAERFAFLAPDNRSLKPLETVLEYMRFWTRVWSCYDSGGAKAPESDTAAERGAEALKLMGISALKDMPIRRLSEGQKRRLSLARVLMKKAPLWLLDEPLNGLDREAHELFTRAVDMHCALGGMIAVASHYTIAPPRHGRLRQLDLGAAA